MMRVMAARKAGHFHVACDVCLWVHPGTLAEDPAYRAADSHTPQCPGHVPEGTTKAQQSKARRIITGNY